MIWLVIWVVFMILWLVFGAWSGYGAPEADRPHRLGNSLIPWVCVLILGLVVFGAIDAGYGFRSAPVTQPERRVP